MHLKPCIGASLVAIGRLYIAQVVALQLTEEHSRYTTGEPEQMIEQARKSILSALALEDIEAETKTEGQMLLESVGDSISKSTQGLEKR